MDAKYTQPKALFYLCQRKIRQFPELQKQLFQLNLVLDYEFTYQKIVKNILHTISTPYFSNNKSFERYFRKLVKEHISPSNYPHFLLVHTQRLLEKIKSFRKIFGMVSDVFYDLHFLEWERVFLLK